MATRRVASPNNSSNSSEMDKDRDLATFIGKERAEKVSELFAKLWPLFHTIGGIVNTIWPFIERIWSSLQSFWNILQPYHPLDLTGVAFGLILAFFGAHYLLVLAAIEAARLTGYEKIKGHLEVLSRTWTQVHRQNLLDNAKDDDNNGKADVDELSRKELFTRKFKLFMRSIDPEEVTGALHGLFVIFMSIIATLRVQFAQTIALGVAISEAVYLPIEKYVVPIVSKGVEPEYRQWVPYVSKNIVRTACVSIAFLVQRVISGFYSSIRGGHLVAQGLLSYLVRHGHIAATHDTQKGLLFSCIVGLIATSGFYFQLSYFWGLPFPLNVAMFPFSTAERILMYFVANANDASIPPSP